MILENFSMRSKFYLLITPLLALIIGMGFYLNYNLYNKLEDAKHLQAQALKEKSVSLFIHEFQKERAKSILFSSKSIPKSELEKQRDEVDKTLQEIKLQFNENSDEYSKINSGIKNFREVVNAGQILIITTPSFKENVSLAIKTLVNLFEHAHYEGMETKFSSLAIFEEAKENMGLLRGKMNSILGQNKILSSKDLDELSALRTGITVNLASPGLQLTKEGKNQIENILHSDEWDDILKKYEVVINKSTQGDYGISTVDFSNTITAQINKVNDVIQSEHATSMNELSKIVNSVRSTFIYSILLMIAIVAATFFLSLKITNSVTSELTNVITGLTETTPQLTDSASSLNTLSTNLSSCATEQAAAVQETASCLEEVYGMITRNAESSETSKKSSVSSLEQVNKGQSSVKNMLNSISEIHQNNESMNSFINKSNKDLEEIVHVITEISEKTKIINEIVFQTKLLSFNASVEAARAGNEGKGFAVVAAEIGNLARKSGQAADDIKDLIDNSVTKVNSIVSTTKMQVDRLANEGHEKIQNGIKRAEECNDVLGVIHNAVSEVEALISDVALASNEQSKGISEVNKAMAQIDQVTHQNSISSQNVSMSSEQVLELSGSIQNYSDRLRIILNGRMKESVSS